MIKIEGELFITDLFKTVVIKDEEFMRKIVSIFFFTFLFVFFNEDIFAYIKAKPLNDSGTQEISIELDHYYSCIDYVVALTKQPVPRRKITHEEELYLHMLANFIFPRFILLEVGAYPLPLAGVFVRQEFNNFYNDSDLNGFNWIKMLTAGYSDPYAVSILLGNVISFEKEGGEGITGRGFSGFAFSYGHHHIVDNIMVVDDWVEIGLRIKGADYQDAHDMSWSYSTGVKFHRNPEIRDQVFFAIYRNRIDYADSDKNLLWKLFVRNAEQQFRVDFSLDNLDIKKPSTISLLFGKHFPIGDGNVTFALRLGAMKVFRDGYVHGLKQDIDHRWSMLLHPMIYFRFD